MRIVTVSILFLALLFSPVSAEPRKFQNANDMFNEFADYSISKGTLKIISNSPLNIRLSPILVEGESDSLIRETTTQALMYGIYRSFIHLDVASVTVTAEPLLWDIRKNVKIKHLSKYRKTVTINRQEALRAIAEHVAVTKYSHLVVSKDFGGGFIIDVWSPKFELVYHKHISDMDRSLKKYQQNGRL